MLIARLRKNDNVATDNMKHFSLILITSISFAQLFAASVFGQKTGMGELKTVQGRSSALSRELVRDSKIS